MKVRAVATPIVLVVLAVVGALYVALVDGGRVSDAERLAQPDRVLPGLHPDEVTRIHLEHGGRTLVIERRRETGEGGAADGRWVIVSPRDEVADSASVDALLRQLELARRVRSVAAGAALGLEAPRATGVLALGTRAVRFALGGDAPTPQGAAYLRVEGDGTFVVEAALKEELLRGEDAYRDRTVVPYGAGGVGALTLQDAAGTTAIERHGATFRLRGGLRAGRAAVDHALVVLSDARVDRFLDDAAADAATAKPALAVTIEPREASRPRVELVLGEACPDAPDDVVLVRRTPSRVSGCVARELLDALDPAKLTADVSPFFAHADEMEQARIAAADGQGPAVEIVRKGSGWRERAPEERDLSADESLSAGALVEALADAAATSVRAPRGDEAATPRFRVTVVRTGTSTSESVDVAAPRADGSAEARRGDDGAVLVLPRAVARRFAPHPVALRGPDVWRVPFDPGTVVAVAAACGAASVAFDLRQGRWTPPTEVPPQAGRKPQGRTQARAGVAGVDEVVAAAAKARAEAWVAEADDGGFGLGSPGACTLRLTLAPTDGGDGVGPTASLELGARAPGSDARQQAVYARVGGNPAVFLTSGGLDEAVSALARAKEP